MPTEGGLWTVLTTHGETAYWFASLLLLLGVFISARLAHRALRLAAALASAQHSGENQAPTPVGQEGRSREYRGLVRMLRHRLDTLPTGPEGAELIRTVASWDIADVARLQQLAVEAEPGAGAAAIEAAAALRWLRDRIEDVKAIPPDLEVRWEHFSWHRWTQDLARARSAIETMAGPHTPSEGVPDLPRSHSAPAPDVTATAA